MKKFNWLFLFLFAFAFVACDEEDEVDIDTTDPTITITSPTAGQALTMGVPIQLRASVMDNMGLDEVRVSITDPAGTEREVSDESITDFLNDDREANVDIDINLDANATTGTYMIMVEAVDDAGNEATQTVSFMMGM